MTGLMEYEDVVVENEEDAEKVFGIKTLGSDVTTGALSRDGYYEVARELVKRFDLGEAAITPRESLSASDNNWPTILHNGNGFYTSRKFGIRVVGRVGGGDSFADGPIYGLTTGMDLQYVVESAVVASCLNHFVEGDFNLANMDEVKRLAAGDASGRVHR